MPIPELPAGVIRVAEQPHDTGGGLTLNVQPQWQQRLPWLLQGTTSGADMSLFGRSAAGDVVTRWLHLGRAMGTGSMVHARQVHENAVLLHQSPPAGILVAGDADGHGTATPGVLLAVSVADCVPIFLVAPERPFIAVLHGGWRGVAAGILERGIELILRAAHAEPAKLLAHFGPAICGDCFQVGSEVPSALGLAAQADDGSKHHVDLRAHLAQRALRLGLSAHDVSVSTFCTRCGDSPFYSHRGGCRERQLGVAAIRSDGP